MQESDNPEVVSDTDPAAQNETLKIIRQMLQTIRFGSIQVIVLDGMITQIDVTTRKRLRAFKMKR